jgi:hypothetical protein
MALTANLTKTQSKSYITNGVVIKHISTNGDENITINVKDKVCIAVSKDNKGVYKAFINVPGKVQVLNDAEELFAHADSKVVTPAETPLSKIDIDNL